MIALAVRDLNNVEIVPHDTSEALSRGTYDAAIVDDALEDFDRILPRLDEAGIDRHAVLYHKLRPETEQYAHPIRKPFLPEDIRTCIRECRTDTETPKQQSDSPAPAETPQTNVLDADEIETIRSLLEEEGLQIVHEETLADTVIDDQDRASSDALVRALKRCKPKQLRKLLKGATVRIEITFPGEQA
jgi:hypothetical protein